MGGERADHQAILVDKWHGQQGADHAADDGVERSSPVVLAGVLDDEGRPVWGHGRQEVRPGAWRRRACGRHRHMLAEQQRHLRIGAAQQPASPLAEPVQSGAVPGCGEQSAGSLGPRLLLRSRSGLVWARGARRPG
jgi:hypothetical protein